MGQSLKTLYRMKNLVLVTLLGLALLQPVVQAIFFGPLAVGAAIGALALGKGLILGGLLARRRSRHTSSYGRSYHRPSYSRNDHYSYGSSYAKPTNTYYYSSQKYNHHGKRSAEEELPTQEELNRFKRQVDNEINDDSWWLEMVEKDQDDCTKRLICEISAKSNMDSDVEEGLMKVFGVGRTVDVSKATALFDLAAQAGKAAGVEACRKFYKRCDTPVKTMVEMIEEELLEFERLEQEFLDESGGNIRRGKTIVEAKMKKEKDEMTSELIKEGIVQDRNQVWV